MAVLQETGGLDPSPSDASKAQVRTLLSTFAVLGMGRVHYSTRGLTPFRVLGLSFSIALSIFANLLLQDVFNSCVDACGREFEGKMPKLQQDIEKQLKRL